ncbi:MAG: hypothetical protein JWO03_3474 [Bacteroidetes bacterium]|nr:hypothetical protein [Bacteroidota bacterium]
MKRSIVIAVCTLFAVMAFLYSCKTDTPLSINEYITTARVIAINQTDLTIDTFQYINFNEAVANPPQYVDTIRLKANTIYSIQLKLMNEASNPSLDLSDSITALGDNHLIVYNMDPSSDMVTVKIKDKDSKGLPIGLMSTWQVKDTTNGSLRLILYHQPGSKNGTITPGNVDFEADYPIVVK